MPDLNTLYKAFRQTELEALSIHDFSDKEVLQKYYISLYAYSQHCPTDRLIQFSIPTIKHPVFLRAKTSDVESIHQLFMQEESELIQLDDPRVIVDLGAYVGYVAVYFASKYPSARVICIEPSSRNFALLRMNTQNYPNITIINSAIWSHNTHLRIVGSMDGDQGNIVKECHPGDPGAFDAISIKSLMDEYSIERIDFLKVNIVGSEKQLFTKNTNEWLDFVDRVGCVPYDRFLPGCTEVYTSLFTSTADFERSQVGENILFKRLDSKCKIGVSGTEQPLVSVITPTYKRADNKIIRRCVGSMLAQTYAEWEQIIFSDGLYEPEVEATLQAINDPRVKYLWSEQNLGHYGAGVRQEAMEHAKGKYLAFLDDDNVLFPLFLEKMVSVLEEQPDKGFAICRIIHNGPLPAHLGHPPQVLTGIPPRLQNIDTLQVVIRKELMQATGWVLEGYKSDGYTYERLAQHYDWVEVPLTLAYHI